MGGVNISRSEIISGMSASAQFSAGLIHPIIHFDVDFKPTRMWCLCRTPASTGKYMCDPVRLWVSLWVPLWCCPARGGTETGSRAQIRRIWHLQKGPPAIGGFLCVCGTQHLISSLSIYQWLLLQSTTLSFTVAHTYQLFVWHIYFQVKAAVHVNYKKLIYSLLVCGAATCF